MAMPESVRVPAVSPIFVRKCRCCVNRKCRENFEVGDICLRKYQECRVVSPERRLPHKKTTSFYRLYKKGASAVKMISRHGLREVRHARLKSLSSCRLAPLARAFSPPKELHESADNRYEGTRKTQPGTRKPHQSACQTRGRRCGGCRCKLKTRPIDWRPG